MSPVDEGPATPPPGEQHRASDRHFSDQLGEKISRKQGARRGRLRDAWYGIGLFGLVGWGVAGPTMLGVALGAWLDQSHPGRTSWTLMGLGFGLLLGCYNAISWISREQSAIHSERKEPPDASDPR